MARTPGGRVAGLAHHDLCFGCGIANLFGLQLEAEQRLDGSVAGRFFVKQDHQGSPGRAHDGVLATALEEAMTLALHAAGIHARPARLEIDLHAPAPVGAFVRVEAAVERRQGGRTWVGGAASEEGESGRALAEARGAFADLPA